jgi:hypothetical protein
MPLAVSGQHIKTEVPVRVTPRRVSVIGAALGVAPVK